MTSTGRLVPALVVLAAVLGLPFGCAPLGGPAGAEPRAELLRVDIPLREPVWVPEEEVVLALDEDRRRVVRVEVGGEGPTVPVRSEVFEDAGENLALSPEEPRRAYLPRPGSGEISALDTDSLRVVESYDVVGPSPSYVTVDVQSEILFAISENGSVVSGVALEEPAEEEVPPVEVGRGPEAIAEAPEKGLYPAFWISGPGGVSYYDNEPIRRLVGRPMEATDIAVDPTSAQTAYVAEGKRVVKLEGDPQRYLEGNLVVTATRDLGERVERVGVDELHVFVASSTSFSALRRESLEVVETVELPEAVRGAAPSGMAIGSKEVYVTFEGEPYILSVKKP